MKQQSHDVKYYAQKTLSIVGIFLCLGPLMGICACEFPFPQGIHKIKKEWWKERKFRYFKMAVAFLVGATGIVTFVCFVISLLTGPMYLPWYGWWTVSFIAGCASVFSVMWITTEHDRSRKEEKEDSA